MKKILVTGAGGYIGRHVVKALLDFDVQVIAIDYNAKDIDKRARIMEYDIFNSDEQTFSKLGDPDVCIHLAWQDGFVHNSSLHINNLPLHFNFINNMIAGGLKHVVVMGSMHEVGYYVGKVNENTPTNPRSLYGIAKNTLRQSIEVLQQNNAFVLQWIRAYYVLGEDHKNNSIFAKILEKENQGISRFPFTSGENKYDFISVDELAFQIASVSMQKEVNGIINCCSGQAVKLKDRAESFIKEQDLSIKLEYGVFPERPYDSPEIYGDKSKMLEILKASLCPNQVIIKRNDQILRTMGEF